jgi:hypothetical protein
MMNMLEEGFLPKKFCAMIAFCDAGKLRKEDQCRYSMTVHFVCVVWRFWKWLRERDDFGNAFRKANLVMKFESMGSVTTI